VVDVLDCRFERGGHSGSLYRLTSNHPDEQENNCHNKEDVQPSAQCCRRHHANQPQDDEQDHEKHQHGDTA
jgi:hypothetical protein